MARVPYLDPEDLPEDQRDLLKRPINLHRALAHTHGGARAFEGIGRWIRFDAAIDPRLRELAILQVGWLARSPYEWSHHVKIGFDFGVTEDDVRALIAESEGRDSGLPALDRAVLRAAREMSDDGAMTPGTFAELNGTLGHEQTVELVMVIAFYNAVVRLLASLEIDVEPSYQPYLDKFPLPAGR